MLEKKSETPESKLNLLRKKVEQVTKQPEFRRKFLGGISEDDVQDFITSVNQQAQKNEEIYQKKLQEVASYEQALKKKLETEGSEIWKLRETAGQLQKINNSLEEEIRKLNDDMEKVRSDLAENASKYGGNEKKQSRLVDGYKIKIRRLEEEVSNLTLDREDMAARLSELEEEAYLNRSQLAEYEKNNDREDRNERDSERELALVMLEEKAAALEKQLEESHTKLNEQYQVNSQLTAQLDEGSRNFDEIQMMKEMEQKLKREQMINTRMFEEKVAALEKQLEESHTKLNEQYQVNSQLLAQLDEGPKTFDETQMMKEMEQKLNREQMTNARMLEENANLKARISQLRDETYKQIEVLTEQMKVRNTVEDQLSYERIRATNVENDMAELVGKVYSLRDKFQNEHTQLDDELGVVKKKHYDNNLGESGYQYIEKIMQQTSQELENVFLSAQNNINSLLNNANAKVQEMSMYYKAFKSDVIGLHNDLESFQGKTSEWIDELYTTAEKSCPLDEKKEMKQISGL